MLRTSHRRRLVLALATTLAISLGALSMTQAGAAATPNSPWISGQAVQGSTVALTLDWNAVPGVASYKIHWTASFDAPVTAPDTKATGDIAGTRVVIPNLAPGTTYCFALEAAGAISDRACKVTTPLSRAVAPTALATTMATLNLRCGSKSKCNTGWKWKKRQKQVVDRIGRMNADVMVFTEGHVAHKYGKKKLYVGKVMKKRGYTLACRTQMSKKRPLYSQTAYVRSNVYAVVNPKRNSKGTRFKMFGDRDHGYCRALLQHRATGKTLAVAAVHLQTGDADGTRQQESSYVLGQVTGAFPGQPTVFLGDFNSHRGIDRKGGVDAPRVLMESAGFADASDIAGQLVNPYLNSSQGFQVDPPRASTWPVHVDRFFVSPGITVPLWENIAVLTANGQYATPMASDHNPVKVTLYIP